MENRCNHLSHLSGLTVSASLGHKPCVQDWYFEFRNDLGIMVASFYTYPKAKAFAKGVNYGRLVKQREEQQPEEQPMKFGDELRATLECNTQGVVDKISPILRTMAAKQRFAVISEDTVGPVSDAFREQLAARFAHEGILMYYSVSHGNGWYRFIW